MAKIDQRTFRLAIEKVGAKPSALAKELGVTRTTVYAYLNKYPALKDTFEAERGEAVADRAQFTREAFMKAIEGSRGIKTEIARRMGCTRQTVDNALERWPELRAALKDERESIVDLAESALVVDMENPASAGHQRAYLFILETLGKDRGWSKRTEVTGADGGALFGLSAEVREMIEAMGLDVSEVVRQFEAMVREAAAAPGGEQGVTQRREGAKAQR